MVEESVYHSSTVCFGGFFSCLARPLLLYQEADKSAIIETFSYHDPMQRTIAGF